MARSQRGALATVVGWVIVALVVYWLLGFVVGTIRFLIRFIVWAIIIGAMVVLYLNLKSPDD
jgi:uncharacterized membrane protein YeaQ/YmgE (transglycosylase-associated protein family)